MSTVYESLPQPSPPIVDEPSLAGVLAEIAETASETLELQEVFERVATAIRRLIPLDNMGVVRIVEGRYAVLHATTVPCGGDSDCSEPEPLASWSPRMRPRPGSIQRLGDAQVELDPQFPMDAFLIEKGVRSAMWAPFRMAAGWSGGVWVSAFTPYAFNDEHEELVRPIAALLGSAVEHWRIWDTERRRRERLGQLETQLGGLVAEALDVREVFERISAAVQPVLAHHLLGLTELDDPGESFHMVALAGESDIPPPTGPVRLSRQEVANRALDFEILRDIAVELGADTERNRLARASGMRSWLRVPVRLWGEVRGSLIFFHREPGRFSEEDVEVAARLADRIAVALSHHRLAEEARVAAEAQRAGRAAGGDGRDAHPRAPGARPRPGGRRLADLEGGAPPDRPGGLLGDHGADHRRVGHRQGGRRPPPPPGLAARRPAARGDQLRGAPRARSSNRSCSATRRAPSPAPSRPRSAAWSRPPAARCSSTRSAR